MRLNYREAPWVLESQLGALNWNAVERNLHGRQTRIRHRHVTRVIAGPYPLDRIYNSTMIYRDPAFRSAP